jgi:hypothetical protein
LYLQNIFSDFHPELFHSVPQLYLVSLRSKCCCLTMFSPKNTQYMRVQIIKLLSENIHLKKYISEYELWSALPATVVGWVCSRYPAATIGS